MKSLAFRLQPLVVALLVVGCRSYGPGFDPRQRDATLGSTNFAEADWMALTNQTQPQWLMPPKDSFRLGPGDIIGIDVLGEAAAVQSHFVIGPDGKIYYSLLPGVVVSGLTLTETKELLEKELARHLRTPPTLSVTLHAAMSKRIWILGTVQSPGTYSLTGPTTVLEAISTAGGVVPVSGSSSGMPDLRTSFLLRNGKPVPIDLQRLLSRGDLSQNAYLQPDDFLYLRSTTSRDIYVLGAVATPRVIPYSDGLSLLSALANAGGTLPYAQVTHVGIIRGSLASPRIGFVNYKSIYKGSGADIPLEQGDIVYVPFVAYQKLAVLADQMLNEFVRTIAINEGSRAVIPNARPTTVTVPSAIGP